jgi:hypothetical protein
VPLSLFNNVFIFLFNKFKPEKLYQPEIPLSPAFPPFNPVSPQIKIPDEMIPCTSLVQALMA